MERGLFSVSVNCKARKDVFPAAHNILLPSSLSKMQPFAADAATPLENSPAIATAVVVVAAKGHLELLLLGLDGSAKLWQSVLPSTFHQPPAAPNFITVPAPATGQWNWAAHQQTAKAREREGRRTEMS